MKIKNENIIRIIGGTHRSRKLPVLSLEGLRPTSDRMKETIFNWLQFDIENSRCLDLFAGTGSLGIEALSRGAQCVDFVEINNEAAAQISSNLEKLSLTDRAQVYCMGALDFLKRAACDQESIPYDVIFIDPPFFLQLHQLIIDELSRPLLFNSHKDNALINNNSFLIVEQPVQDYSFQLPKEFLCEKESSTRYSKIQLIKIIV